MNQLTYIEAYILPKIQKWKITVNNSYQMVPYYLRFLKWTKSTLTYYKYREAEHNVILLVAIGVLPRSSWGNIWSIFCAREVEKNN